MANIRAEMHPSILIFVMRVAWMPFVINMLYFRISFYTPPDLNSGKPNQEQMILWK